MLRTMVAMSGGADSSAAALILRNSGYSVTGVTLKLFDNEESENTITIAKQVCEQLCIPHEVLDVTKKFNNDVIIPFVDYYRSGLTPNPCLCCNPLFKWDVMLNRADIHPDTYLATGHYAGITEIKGRKVLRRGKGKDQSYFLHRLSSEQIARSLFPVGDYQKQDLRRELKLNGLDIADRPDSQEVCFIQGKLADFFESQSGKDPEPGNIVDLDGKIRGRHKGLHHYTVGQRSGLGIAAPQPLYVIRIDVLNNLLVVGEKKDTLTKVFHIHKTKWSGIDAPEETINCLVQVRFRHKPVLCSVSLVPGSESMYVVEILNDEGAVIAPGQGAAFYRDEIVLGGGEICRDDLII